MAIKIRQFGSNCEAITIGRDPNNTIAILDSRVSKFQFTIVFQPYKGWVIKEGVDKHSPTANTWVYLEGREVITSNSEWKVGGRLYSISEFQK